MDMSCFDQHPWMMDAFEFEYDFTSTRKDVHLYFVMRPGKMIRAVLEL